MSTIDGSEMFRGDVGSRAGAAFLLTAKAPMNREWRRDDGWAVEIREGSRYVVANGGSASHYREVWTTAHEVAQKALDVWSLRGLGDLATESPFGNHLAFWDCESGSVLRIVGREPLGISMRTEATVRNAAGEIVIPPSPAEFWHQSMRFYRRSQLTNDPVEATRLLWLAVENLLDDEVAEHVEGETEAHWLKRALKLAEEHVAFAHYLPEPPTDRVPKLPHNAAYDYFYEDLRHDVFHAKASHQPRLPDHAVDVLPIIERHEPLTRLYLDLLNKTVGVERSGGGVLTYGGFGLMTRAFDNEPRLYLTNYSGAFDRSETDPAPAGRDVLDAAADPAPDQERPWLRVYLATMSGDAVEALGSVTRMTLTTGGTSAIAILMEGDLRVANVDRVEAQLEVALRNASQPKSFPTG